MPQVGWISRVLNKKRAKSESQSPKVHTEVFILYKSLKMAKVSKGKH